MRVHRYEELEDDEDHSDVDKLSAVSMVIQT